jgi:hypothetical protein
VWAARLYTIGRRRQYLNQMSHFVTGFLTKTGVFDPFAWQGTFNEDGFAILARDASRFMIQRLDNSDWHGRLQKKPEF